MVDPRNFDKIQRYVASGQFDSAESVCLSIEDKESADPSFWQLRGSIALLAEDWNGVEAHFGQASTLALDAPQPWLGIARALVGGGRITAAGVAADRAISLGLDGDESLAAYEIVANSQFSLGNIDSGRALLAALAPHYQGKFSGDQSWPDEIIQPALAAGMCARDNTLVEQLLKQKYPIAHRLSPISIAPTSSLETWCREAGVPVQVVEDRRQVKIDATSQYTRDYLYSTDPILFASIPGGQWVPGWDFPIGSDGTVIDDAGYLDIIHVFNHAPHAHFPSAELVAHHVPHAVEEIDEDVLFVSAPMHNHLGHWLVDFLPRLQGRTLAGCSPLRIAVPDTLAGAKIEETLALASLDESDILRCRTDALYQFRTLHIYRMGRSLPPNPLHVHFLRDLLGVKSPPAQHDGKKKRVFFDRTNVGSRLVANKKEFDAVLLEYDFVSVNLGELTLAQQLNLFADVEIILGAVGTDLWSTYFAPPGCTVITMLWDEKIDSGTPPTCFILGQYYQYLHCPIARESKNWRSWVDYDFAVDCNELRKRLQEIIGDR